MGGEVQTRLDAGPEDAAEQRQLLVAAFTKAAAEHGYADLEVEQVLRYAGVPRAVFEAHFSGKEQALLAAQDAFFERLWLDMTGACEGDAEWPLKVRAALSATLASLDEASALARVFTVEAAAASAAAVERQFTALDRFATLLRDGRALYPGAAALPAVTERALVGGIASILCGHLLVEEAWEIPALESQLVELLLLPYLGSDEARRLART